LNTFQKTSVRATLIAATLAAMPFSANAAGLGRISVLSALGQPLRAEIELTATADELSSMEASVAPVTAFKDAGIAYASVLRDVRMSVERRGGRAVLKLSSVRPVNDPFMDVLVELNWSAGRLLREYTFLLDPPDMPAPASSANVGSAVNKPAARAARPIGGAAPGDYRVRRGDTLGKIARQYKPAGVSMDQMLIALYQANPEAFVDNNINRLRAGVILNVPDANTASAVPAGEARQQVIAHASDFNAYRRRVAERVADSAPVEPTAGSQSAGGKITAKVEEAPTPVTESKDQVKVSQSTETGTTVPTTELNEANERLKSLEEDVVARDRALKEANDRLAALEQNIAELQKLIELKNESLASLQQQAQGGDAVAAAPAPVVPAETPPPMPSAGETTPVEPAATEPAPQAEMTEPAPDVPAEAQDALGQELQDLVKPDAPVTEAPVAAEPAPTPLPEPEPKPEPAAEVAPPPVMPAPTPKPAPSFVDSLTSNPLAIGGVLAALAAALGLVALRRKKAGGSAPNETAMASVFPPDQNSVFGETGGQSVDTGSSSLIQTDFSQSGLSAIDTDEGVDPVAEADVYMAYGRDAQAEEILLDAMKADPTRTAIHLKLLEIYSQRKNLQQFETTATELYTATGGKGEAWDKAVEMGTKLDPDNPLFKREPAPEVGSSPKEASNEGFTAPSSGTAAAAAAAALTGMAVASASGADEAAAEEKDDFDASLDFNGAIPTPDDPSPSQMKDTWAIPGELNQFTDSDADELLDRVESVQADEGAEEDIAIDTGDLDFNLDLDETDVDGDVVEEAQAAEPAADEEGLEFDTAFDAADSSLEFNLDLSEPPPGNENMAETSVSGVLPDISLESTDLTGNATEAALDSAEDDNAVEIDLEATDLGTSSGIDFESALNAGQEAVQTGSEDVAVVDLEKTNFEGSLLDFDFDLDEGKSASSEENMMATSLDLSDINLDLEGGDAPDLPEAVDVSADEAMVPELDLPEIGTSAAGEGGANEPAAAPEVKEVPADTFAESSPQLDQASGGEDLMMASLTKSVVTSLTDSRSMPDLPADEELNQEVDTKLELARAYEEMGDAEGARELLDEVMRDGDGNQQEQARSILARLG